MLMRHEVVQQRLDALPPRLVVVAHRLHHVGLARAARFVFWARSASTSYSSSPFTSRHLPQITHDSNFFGDLAVLHDELAVGQRFCRAAQQAGEARRRGTARPPASRFGGGDAAQVAQRRQQVGVLRRHGDVARLAELAVRPANPARHAMAAVVVGRLAGPQAGVERLHAGRAAVVGHEDDDRVVRAASRSSRNFSRSPNRLSRWAIMPKKPAGPLPWYGLMYSSRSMCGACGAFVGR